MRQHEDDFAPFIEDNRSFSAYVAEMSRCGVWGGNMELQALSMALGVNIRIHQLKGPRSYDIRNHNHRKAPIIHLSYHRNEHYASVRPFATARSAGPAHHSPLPPLDTIPTSEISTCTSFASSSGHDEVSEDEESPFLSEINERVKRLLANLDAVEDNISCAISEQEQHLLNRTGSVAFKKWRSKLSQLEDVVATIRDDIACGKSRAERLEDIMKDGEVSDSDKRVLRSRKRIYGILEESSARIDGLEGSVASLRRASTSSHCGCHEVACRQPSEPGKKLSKKKVQETKRLEQKARRRREQERTARGARHGHTDHSQVNTALRDIII